VHLIDWDKANPKIVNMIELEAENNFGCIEMRWRLKLDWSLAVSTSVARTEPEPGFTSVTLETVDKAINVHLNVLIEIIFNLAL
jgi:hypothetical protein